MNFGLQMTTSTSIWVASGPFGSGAKLRHFMLRDNESNYTLTEDLAIEIEDSNGFNFDVQERNNETLIVMGYPLFTPTDSSNPD